MEKITLNEQVTLTFPDGFRKLTDDEQRQMRAIQSGPGVCLKNEEKHIILSLGYRRTGFFDTLLNGKDLIKSAQGRIAGVMRPFGYRLTEYKPRNVGGRDASCFQYAYTAQNTEMMGECCAVKEGKTVYYLHFYVRAAFQEEGFRLWQDILAKAQWA